MTLSFMSLSISFTLYMVHGMYFIKRVVTRTVEVELHLVLSFGVYNFQGRLQVEYGKK